MLTSLKHHPSAIKAHFDFSIVLSFAIPAKEIEHLLPLFLTLDEFQEEYAFFTVALVKVNNLIPKGLPSFLGQSFHLVGHRLFVNYINEKGKRLRGLYILKSQTDKQRMVWLGNIMTQYKYEKKSIKSEYNNRDIIIECGDNDIINVSKGNEKTPLPEQSVFETWKEARRFAGPLPFTFSALKERDKVLIIEGARTNWVPTPLEINELQLDMSEYSFMKNAKLSNAFIVEDISYVWKKGEVETWKI